ncbi:C40 family peptidase [Streptomyces sp. NBC_01465]|uniref:C40 family peptidase n=1 Tax=Streptomyces sp. NBC_01465 TaxID=2903878 RepID=UPI002E2F12DF|nr:C40 family peptidase [Streptomyces sp. NBC_01465]
MTKTVKAWAVAGSAVVTLALVLLTAIAANVAGVGNDQAQAAARNRSQCTTTGGAGGEEVDAAQVAAQVRAVLAGSTSTVTVSGLSAPAEQIPNARVIVATGVQLKVSARGQVIALATALQESGLRNLSGGDRDSLGLFQQRPSQGWGTRAQILDPVYAATKFYRALKSVKHWEQLRLTDAAQKVQKSAFPGAYARHEALATALQQAIAPTLGSPIASTYTTSSATRRCGHEVSIDPGTSGQLPAGYQIPAAPVAVRTAIRWALDQLGTPYQWGGTCTNPHGSEPRDRCDCSSLMQRAYGVAGIELPRVTYDQVKVGRPVAVSAIRPGDLIFTVGAASRPEHVAMAIGNGLLVQAPRPGRSVDVVKIDLESVLAVRRITG